jgi:poly-gamma-glutamate synthesis protein (capsule biosynthesis protein)
MRRALLIISFFAAVFSFLGFYILQREKVEMFVLPRLENIRQIGPAEVEIILTGDVMLGRTVMGKSLELNDPFYPFRKTANVLKAADLVFVNLENPIIEDCPPDNSSLKFCTKPVMVEGLKFAGVDIVSLANNHVGNYGQPAIEETEKHLKEAKIAVAPLKNGEFLVKRIGETRFGFLGFNYVDAFPTDDESWIREAAKRADVLIVGVHWGDEYTDQPNQKQRYIAGKLVEWGADVVVGHHPHWVQSVEYINSKPIYYSLGNFIFDQMWSTKTREGLVMRLTFKEGKLIKEEKLPIFMADWAQPEFRIP